jgi:hypothetical protein
MDIHRKLAEIIPPNDYQHRYEFNNHNLIDKLTNDEKKEIENALIEKLVAIPEDILIVETLSYIKSEKAIPAMNYSLKNCKIEIQKIIIAVSIYKINKDDEMIDVAIKAFKRIANKWDLIISFCYLKPFDSPKINEIIQEYIDHREYLVSYNAKRALGIIKD